MVTSRITATPLTQSAPTAFHAWLASSESLSQVAHPRDSLLVAQRTHLPAISTLTISLRFSASVVPSVVPAQLARLEAAPPGQAAAMYMIQNV